MKKITLRNLGKSARNVFGITAVLIGTGSVYAQPYINGNLETGTISKSGVVAPAGYAWSEVQNDLGNTTESNSTTGVGAQIIVGPPATSNRVADDFTVPAGQIWNLTHVTFYAYQTNYAGTASPFVGLRIRISNGNPSSATPPTVVFGDLTTNRLTSSTEAMVYRISNTTTPAPGIVAGTTRKIWKIEANITASLPEGIYWIEWQQDAGANGNFSPGSTVVDARTQPGYNAIQFQSATGTWVVLSDLGNPAATAPDVAIDMPFMLDYTLTLGVSQNELSSKISVYPNPVKNVVNVDVPSDILVESAEIYDLTGRMVKSQNSAAGIQSINVSGLSSGNYILKLKSVQGSVTKKFIKD
ncbi:MAG TPA: T9SS type A sorting domain-containing protein [Flavobacterium sp.]|nr:T9SS type A sorting domain-containing protein [Flavobacterium sp.]